MSFEVPKDKILHDNVRFIESLTGNEWVGVDKKGRLYAVKGVLQSTVFLCAARIFQKNIHGQVTAALKEYLATKQIEWKKEGTLQDKRGFYVDLIRRLSKLKLLTPEDKELLISAFYEQRYQDLLAERRSPFAAESIVTIEMSQDPYVSESVKQLIRPRLAPSGVNGTYFIRDRTGKNIAVFKPMDEEENMPNNPRGRMAEYDPTKKLIRAPRRGHLQGTGWKKEVAAWLIDQGKIAGVPETVVLSVRFPRTPRSPESILKQGSLQQFVRGESADGLSYDQMLALPPRAVHRLAILDLIIGNADRHWGNCFWDGKSLIPIDHGISLLDSLDFRPDNPQPTSEMDCLWSELPQLKEQLGQDLAKWASSLNGEEIARDLRKALDFPESSIRELKIRLMILQKALQRGFSLSEIAPMFLATASLDLCLAEACAQDAALECARFESQWKELKPPEADNKRFQIYFEILQTFVELQLKERKEEKKL